MSAARPRVSAVVLGGEQATRSLTCLRALLAGATTPDEIVLVVPEGQGPDASADTAGVAVRTIRASKGATWAEACNLGLGQATGDLVAVLDADCEVGPTWLDLLVQFLAEQPEAAAVEGRRTLRSADPSSAPRHQGHLEVDTAALTWTEHLDGSDRTYEVACLSRYAFVIRRDAIKDFGPSPVDTRFETDMAANDLFARLLERRLRLYHLPSAEVCLSPSMDRPAPELDSARRRELLLFAWKHLSKRQRDQQIALTAKLANRGLRGLLSPPNPAAPAARAALAWMRAHERELAAERAASNVPDGAFTDAADAAQARSKYFFYVRQEIVDLIPVHAKVVVDVGCAAGILGAAIKRQRPGIQVRGVEISSDVAAKARAVLDDVYCGSAEDALPPDWPKPDCVIFADVLEHLPNPWGVLRRYRELLGEGGAVVVSVPNIGHRSVVEGLLRGKFEYAEAGILDRTHLRFFTRASAVELLQKSGFRVERIVRNQDRPDNAPWLRLAKQILRESPFLEDIHAVQFILVGRAV